MRATGVSGLRSADRVVQRAIAGTGGMERAGAAKLLELEIQGNGRQRTRDGQVRAGLCRATQNAVQLGVRHEQDGSMSLKPAGQLCPPIGCAGAGPDVDRGQRARRVGRQRRGIERRRTAEPAGEILRGRRDQPIDIGQRGVNDDQLAHALPLRWNAIASTIDAMPIPSASMATSEIAPLRVGTLLW